MAGFTTLDYLIFLVFFANVVLGLARGIYKEAISLICVVVAFIVAIHFTGRLAIFLNGSQGFQDVLTVFVKFWDIHVSAYLQYISYGVSFLVLFVGTYSLGEAANFYTAFEWFIFPFVLLGRLLGGVFGLIRGYAFNVVLIMILQLTPAVGTSAWGDSYFIPKLKPYVNQLAHSIQPGGFPSWGS